MMTTPAPLLSVVVIGRNEGPRLRRCLASVRSMKPLDCGVEIVYVDSASTDDSREVAREMGAQVIATRPLRPTAALGRNAGWRLSRGRFILFLDGDTILDADFVARSVEEFANDTAVIFGNRREIHPEASIFNRVLDLDWTSAFGIVDACGGDALMRREALEAVNGYDESLIAGEEPEMCRRMRALGWKVMHVDRPMTRHDLAMTQWSQYLRRAMRTGYAYAEVSERFRGSPLPFWEREARHNRKYALIQIGMVTGMLLSSAISRSGWPTGIFVIGLVLLALRTAERVRWKTSSLLTRFLYGLHSHLQQIPIFVGQLLYWRDRRRGRARGLIEYKEASP